MATAEIHTFAKQFLERLASLPIKYGIDYNAPQGQGVSKGQSTSKGASSASRSAKATVQVMEIALKSITKGITATGRISRTEPTLQRLRQMAANLLDCPLEAVVLVQNGRVQQLNDVSAVVASSQPVYIFDNREWTGANSGDLNIGQLRGDLRAVLSKHHLDCSTTTLDQILSVVIRN